MRQIDPSTGGPGRIPSRGGEPEDLSEEELRERGALFSTTQGSDYRGGEAFDMQTAKALGQVPPVGTWRMDPVLGYLEQLQLVPVDELSFSESTTDPVIRHSVDKYVGYYQAGLQPPPADVVWNEPTQRLMTLNRRRVLAAKEAGVPSILAWVGGDTYENMKERAMRRRNPAELLLLNPAASRPLSMGEVQQVMVDLAVPKAWRTRFMQGMDVEWREHGGGIDAHSVGVLVKDHRTEDPNYYSRSRRHNPVESAQVEGADRLPYLDAVWSMYVASYSKIGLIVGRAEELLDEYDVWEVSVDETGIPRAFCLYKRTPFGLKVGLSGSDGSPEGRAVARASFATKYQRPGVYGEVSHRPAELARAAGVPVVCANVASVVLRKQIDPVDDVRYVRNLANVGPVQKMLVGMPLGVPTTDIQQPECPVVRMNPSRPPTPDDLADLDAHYASVIGF